MAAAVAVRRDRLMGVQCSQHFVPALQQYLCFKICALKFVFHFPICQRFYGLNVVVFLPAERGVYMELLSVN